MPDPSGVYVTEEQTQQVPPNIRTQALVAALLVTERGPLTPTLCRSSEQFASLFGGPTENCLPSWLAQRSYWENGGRMLLVSRVVHHTTPTDPLTATCTTGEIVLSTDALAAGSGSVLASNVGPYDLSQLTPSATLDVARDGAGAVTATFTGAAAGRNSVDGPFALTNGMNLTLTIGGGPVQTIVFSTGQFANIGAATPAEVAAVINGVLVGGRGLVSGSASRIETDQKGTGAAINITGGTANAVLQFATGNLNGTGNVANLASVTVGEVETVVETALATVSVTNDGGRPRITSSSSGTGSSVQVNASSTADTILGFDNALHSGNAAGAQPTLRVMGRSPGAYTDEIRPILSASSSGDAGRFNLAVEQRGVVGRRYSDLSMDPADRRYAPRVVNAAIEAGGDPLILLEDLDAIAGFPDNRPAFGTFGPLSGGNDGLSGLNDNDFIGGVSANGKQGLYKFDRERPSDLICPQRATPAVHNAMLSYCGITRNKSIYPILDIPAGYSGADALDYQKNVAALFEATDNGHMSWPRHLVTNPDKSLFGTDEVIVAPNSGMIAGVIARVQGAKEGGVSDQPAGPDVRYLPVNVRGLETNEVLDDDVRGAVLDANINPLHRKRDLRPGSDGRFGPVYIDGTRNLSTTGSWPTVGQRRLVIEIKKQLEAILDPMRHRNITDELIEDMNSEALRYMEAMTRAGAFATRDPERAFQLDFGPGINTATTRAQGKTYGRVGIYSAAANEMIFITLGPDTRAIDAELAADTQ